MIVYIGYMLTKVCSLKRDGEEILSIEVETVEGLPVPRIERQWLRNVLAQVIRETNERNTPKKIGRGEGNRTPKAVRV